MRHVVVICLISGVIAAQSADARAQASPWNCAAEGLHLCVAHAMTMGFLAPSDFIERRAVITQAVGGMTQPIVTCLRLVDAAQSAEAARLAPLVEQFDAMARSRGLPPGGSTFHEEFNNATGAARSARIAAIGLTSPDRLDGSPDYQMQQIWVRDIEAVLKTAGSQPWGAAVRQTYDNMPGMLLGYFQGVVGAACR